MPPRKKTVSVSETPTSLPVSKKIHDDNKQITVLETLKTQISQEIIRLIDILIIEVNTLESEKKRWREEQDLHDRFQKQTHEENQFKESLDRKKKQAEFEEQMEINKKKWEETKKQQEEILSEQKEQWKTKEEEYENLKEQVDRFANELAKATSSAEKHIADLLKKDFEIEKRLLIQKYETELKLLQQQVVMMQTQIKQLERESVLLKEEKNRAGEQMKEMAVAIVGKRETNTSTTVD